MPECPFIDPILDMEKWHSYDFKSCNVSEFGPPEDKDSVEGRRYAFGTQHFSFNVLVSDRIGPKRELPTMAHEKYVVFV